MTIGHTIRDVDSEGKHQATTIFHELEKKRATFFEDYDDDGLAIQSPLIPSTARNPPANQYDSDDWLPLH